MILYEWMILCFFIYLFGLVSFVVCKWCVWSNGFISHLGCYIFVHYVFIHLTKATWFSSCSFPDLKQSTKLKGKWNLCLFFVFFYFASYVLDQMPKRVCEILYLSLKNPHYRNFKVAQISSFTLIFYYTVF